MVDRLKGGGGKVLRVFAFLFILSVAFQNCRLQPISEPLSSKPAPAGPDDKESYTLEGNGDIYDGKTEYVTVDREQECGPGNLNVKNSIKVENDSFFLVKKDCQDIDPRPLTKSEVESAPHDPDMLIYDGKAFLEIQHFDSPQAITAVSSLVCKKWEKSEDKKTVTATHTYWSKVSDLSGFTYVGHTSMGKYERAGTGSVYDLKHLVNFAEQDLGMVTDMEPILPFMPPPDPLFPEVLVFSYGGLFPAPNTYILELMAPNTSSNYTKAHLVMMDGSTEHKITDMNCYPF